MTASEGTAERARALLDGILLASAGSGPLLQRDYWAVIEGCRLSPPELADLVARDFCAFAPEDLVRFETTREGGLAPGDEMDIDIKLAGPCRVRVLHRDRNSLTLGTLEGHPEAGRITFGAYRNDAGDVIFHIRSRARSASALKFAGFLTAGDPLQTTTWTDFIDQVAHTAGTGVIGSIRTETRKVEDDPEDPESVCSPTFTAVGD